MDLYSNPLFDGTLFTSQFWEWFIILPVLLGILGCFLLIWWMSVNIKKPEEGEQVETMGHVWDEDLEEYNNPLPAWWLNMFIITLVFGLLYLVLYPGLGSFAGILKENQYVEYDREIKDAKVRYDKIYAQYESVPVNELVNNPDAVKVGQRLYSTYCTVCHGSDARGVPGYPNLADQDWVWGGSPEQIKSTIMHGRNVDDAQPKVMRAWKDIIGDDGVKAVAQYIMSWSRDDVTADEKGKALYMTYCVGCHKADGTGRQDYVGAPNLTDDIWLFGASAAAIEESIAEGRKGKMPAHGDFLGEAKVHLLTAYIYSLSNKPAAD